MSKRFNPSNSAKHNGLEYIGDVNIEYGGAFYNLSTFDKGYVGTIRVTDLDSATGFDGAIMIESGIVYGTLEPKDVKDALECCGFDMHSEEWRTMSTKDKRLAIADSLQAYKGNGDSNPLIYQPERSNPDKFDGWQAERKSWTNIFKDLRSMLKWL